MNKRTIKDLLYEQVARIGKATSSPKRLELLELLAQGEKSVEILADELSIAIKLASAHLKVLKEARLVVARKEGKYVYYRLAGKDVGDLWVAMREVAQEHLVELRVALDEIASAPDKLCRIDETGSGGADTGPLELKPARFARKIRAISATSAKSYSGNVVRVGIGSGFRLVG